MSELVLDTQLEAISPRQLAWIRFKRHRLAMVSGCFLIFIEFILSIPSLLFISVPKPYMVSVGYAMI